MQKTTGNHSGSADRILGYLASKGGQASRRQKQTSRILRGGVDFYEHIVDLLIQQGKIICDTSCAQKARWIYKLAQPASQVAKPVQQPKQPIRIKGKGRQEINQPCLPGSADETNQPTPIRANKYWTRPGPNWMLGEGSIRCCLSCIHCSRPWICLGSNWP